VFTTSTAYQFTDLTNANFSNVFASSSYDLNNTKKNNDITGVYERTVRGKVNLVLKMFNLQIYIYYTKEMVHIKQSWPNKRLPLLLTGKNISPAQWQWPLKITYESEEQHLSKATKIYVAAWCCSTEVRQ